MLLTAFLTFLSLFTIYIIGFIIYYYHNFKLFNMVQEDLEWILVDFLLTDKDNQDTFKTMIARHEMIFDHLSDRITLLHSKTSNFKFELGCRLYNLFLLPIKLRIGLSLLINVVDDIGFEELNKIKPASKEQFSKVSENSKKFYKSVREKRNHSIGYLN